MDLHASRDIFIQIVIARALWSFYRSLERSESAMASSKLVCYNDYTCDMCVQYYGVGVCFFVMKCTIYAFKRAAVYIH